jgi:hypothetical protein
VISFRFSRFCPLLLNPPPIELGKSPGFLYGNTLRDGYPDTFKRPHGNVDPFGFAAALKKDVAYIFDSK